MDAVTQPGRVLKFLLPRTVWVLIRYEQPRRKLHVGTAKRSWMIFESSLAPRKNRMDAINETKDTPQFFLQDHENT